MCLDSSRSSSSAQPALDFFFSTQVGSGYKVHELQELNDAIKDHAIPYVKPKGSGTSGGNGSGYPKWLHAWNMKRDDVPDVFFPPSKSKVIEIKCAEIVTTDQFSSGHTPRFPRCENIRYDKGWHEALTQKGLAELCRSGRARVATLGTGGIGGGSGEGGAFGDSGARRLKRRAAQARAAVDRFAVQADKGVVSKTDALAGLPGNKAVSSIFAGYSFSVLSWAGEERVPEVPGVALPWHRPSTLGGTGGSGKSGGGAVSGTQQSQLSQLSQEFGSSESPDPEEAKRQSAQRQVGSKKGPFLRLLFLSRETNAELPQGLACPALENSSSLAAAVVVVVAAAAAVIVVVDGALMCCFASRSPLSCRGAHAPHRSGARSTRCRRCSDCCTCKKHGSRLIPPTHMLAHHKGGSETTHTGRHATPHATLT